MSKGEEDKDQNGSVSDFQEVGRKQILTKKNWPDNMGPRIGKMGFNSGVPIQFLLLLASVKLKFLAVPT